MNSHKKWYLIISSLLFALMTMCIKMLAGKLPVYELLFFRFSGGMIICLLADRTCYKFAENSFKMLFLRGLYGTFAMFCFFYAINYIPISRLSALHFNYPLYEIIFSAIWIKERPAKIIYLSLPVSLIGIYFITNPEAGFNFGDILGILSGIFGGLAIIGVRQARIKNSPPTIFFYFCVFGILASGIPSFLSWATPPASSLWLIFCVVLFGGIGQLVMNYAFKYSRVGEGTIITLITVVFINILGFVFLKELITFRLLFGEVLVVASILLLLIKKIKYNEVPLK